MAVALHRSQLIALEPAPYLRLKQGVWVYFLLLIFEGAMRKWLLPSLATPLLIIRDPVALWLIFAAWRRGLLPANPYMSIMFLIGITGIYTAVFFGHGNIWVALYGARTMLLHFPLIFAIGSIFNQEDVLNLGRFTLWLAIPMTLLIAVQFYSPQSAFVNRGVGGDISGAGFSGALDYFRPPGTFSFTNGTSMFYGFLSSFVFYFWINPHFINRLLLLSATACLLAAIPLSISRGLFFQTFVTLFFAALAIWKKPEYLARMILGLVIGLVALAFFSHNNHLQPAIEAFTVRFESANEQEGGLKGVLGDRYLGGMMGGLNSAGEQPFLGHGLGMGSNVGSLLLTGDRIYLISEEEWGRIIGELGAVLGLTVILMRFMLTFKIALEAYRRLSINDFLPWMLLSFCFLNLMEAQWGQPTSLGFSIVSAGLTIASLRIRADA